MHSIRPDQHKKIIDLHQKDQIKETMISAIGAYFNANKSKLRLLLYKCFKMLKNCNKKKRYENLNCIDDYIDHYWLTNMSEDLSVFE